MVKFPYVSAPSTVQEDDMQIVCRMINEILLDLAQDKCQLSNFAIQRLPAKVIPTLKKLVGVEVSYDYIFESDDGKYLYRQRNDLHDFVLIASANGDEWLLSTIDEKVYFFDHNDWENAHPKPMGIDFDQFVILADLMRQYDRFCDEGYDSQAIIPQLKSEMNSLSPNLSEKYPFNLE